MLVVSTSHSLLLVDPASGEFTPIHRGNGLYYGIANHDGRWYVAARGRTPSSDSPGEEERGRILVFDADWRLVEAILAPFPLRDMHEILAHDGRLWITCSYDNMIAILDLRRAQWERWYPLGETPSPPYDLNHINSLAVSGDDMLVIAHNRGKSELLRFNQASRHLLARSPFGIQSHNIREDDGRLITCSSGDGTLVDAGEWRLEVGGFPRGLLLSDRLRYVGISTIAERHERDFTDGQIAVFDEDWHLMHTITLPREGLVLDIQPFVRTSALD